MTTTDAKKLRGRVIRVRLTLVVVGVVCAASLWFALSPARNSTLARVRRAGVLRIGYAIEAPYIFLDAEGKLTGLECETGKVVAGRLAIPRIEWVQTEFGSLISDLEADRFDIIVAGMFITPERARRVIFSEPTFHVRQALLVQVGNPYRLHSYTDVLQHPEVKIAALRGAIEEDLLSNLGVPESQRISVPDVLTGRVAVEIGLAGSLALSLPTIRRMVQQGAMGNTEISQPFAQPAPVGGYLNGFGAVAFRKSDDALRQAWNRELARFIGSAEHRVLLFQAGFSDDDLPGTVTTDMILSMDTP